MRYDSEGNACPFCPENGMVQIVDETDNWYLVYALYAGEVVDDAMLAVPREHHATIDDLPIEWGAELGELLHMASRFIRPDQLAINLTRPSKTVEHIHIWFVEQDIVLDQNVGFYTMLRRLRKEKQDHQLLASMGSTH